MSRTTERIFWEAAIAGVSVAEYLAAMQDIQDQAVDATHYERWLASMDIEDAEIEELCDGNL